MRALLFLLTAVLTAGLPACRKREQPPSPRTETGSERSGVLAPKKQIDRAGQAARDAQKTFRGDGGAEKD